MKYKITFTLFVLVAIFVNYGFAQKSINKNSTPPLKILYKHIDSTELYLYFYYPEEYNCKKKQPKNSNKKWKMPGTGVIFFSMMGRNMDSLTPGIRSIIKKPFMNLISSLNHLVF